MDRDHITELGNQRPKKPFFFLKPPSTIVPAGESGQAVKPVLIPKGVNCHYEVELALVVGKTLENFRYVKKQHGESMEKLSQFWQDKLMGYAIGNKILSRDKRWKNLLFLGIDLTARNLQDEAKKAGLPWSSAKGKSIELSGRYINC